MHLSRASCVLRVNKTCESWICSIGAAKKNPSPQKGASAFTWIHPISKVRMLRLPLHRHEEEKVSSFFQARRGKPAVSFSGSAPCRAPTNQLYLSWGTWYGFTIAEDCCEVKAGGRGLDTRHSTFWAFEHPGGIVNMLICGCLCPCRCCQCLMEQLIALQVQRVMYLRIMSEL